MIKRKKLNLTPLIYGGGQESGLRSGTENVFGIAVFGDAAEKKRKNLKDNYEIAKNNKSLFLSLIKDDDLKIITQKFFAVYRKFICRRFKRRSDTSYARRKGRNRRYRIGVLFKKPLQQSTGSMRI